MWKFTKTAIIDSSFENVVFDTKSVPAYNYCLHRESWYSISFHIEWDMIMVTVFLSRSYLIQCERKWKHSFLSAYNACIRRCPKMEESSQYIGEACMLTVYAALLIFQSLRNSEKLQSFFSDRSFLFRIF